MSSLALVKAAPLDDDDRAERLRALIRPEFLVDVYIADEGDAVLSYRGRWHDLRDAPRLMRLELQYALQCRHDARRGTFEARIVNRLVRAVAHCLDGDSFCTAIMPDSCWNTEQAYWRYIVAVTGEVYDQRDELERDTWRLRRLGIGTKGKSKFLRFELIPQAWLRTMAKQSLRYQLARGLSASALCTHLVAQTEFARWLHEHHPRIHAPEQIDRQLLEQFVVEVRTQQHPGYARKKLLPLKALVEDAREFGWGTFGGRLYSTDIPREPELSPKAIDEFIMAQVESPSGLASIDCPDRRGLIQLIALTGMRGSEARLLAFDPLTHDSTGAPSLTYEISKTGLSKHTIPVLQRVADIVEDQQHRVRERYGKDTPYLFPRLKANPDGLLPWGNAIEGYFRRWLTQAAIRDRQGQPVRITLHQFRHTLGTRMVNHGVDMTVVKRMLGHKSIAMTEHYARLNDQRLRQEFERFSATRVNIYGQLVQVSRSDLAWTKERLARALVTTQNGYCGRPLQLECPHPNACLTCPDFLTDVSHLPAHRRQLEETHKLIALAEGKANTRMAEMNRQVAANIEKIITRLESVEGAGHDGDAA